MEIWTRNAFVWTFIAYFGHDAILGTDIGYQCTTDSECLEGNGGKYTTCSDLFHVCVCTINIKGEEAYYSTKCDDRACTIAGYCSKECAPKEISKWRDDQDWYGSIALPFSPIFVVDKKTAVCFDPDRALNSLPDGFIIKNSSIPGAGLGVFTDHYIQRDTILGPYKGIIEPDGNKAAESGYAWKLKPDTVHSETKWIDARFKFQSNWIRYINMPNSAAVENFVAVQYKGAMYYQAFRSIPAGTELMVHYGDEYAEYLNISDYPPPTYYYSHKEYVGGVCELGEGSRCLHDRNTICVDKACICRLGSHVRYGACITDETLGGRCFQPEGGTCRNDEDAVCQRGICVCKENCTAVNNVCIRDETFGGRCSGENGEDCLIDRNAECVHGICDCKYSTTAIYGICIKDGTVGGRCKARDGNRCKVDKNAQCWGGFCQCKDGASDVNGTCMLDELAGGRCKGKDSDSCSLDRNALCVNSTCVCRPGTSQIKVLCVQDEAFGGKCSGQNNSVCLRDSNARCVDGLCICRDGASDIDGACVPDERLGGKCVGSTGWPCKLDKKAVCKDGRCECRSGTSEANGVCVSDGNLGGACNNGMCDGSDIICDSEINKCICKPGFVYYGGRCVQQ